MISISYDPGVDAAFIYFGHDRSHSFQTLTEVHLVKNNRLKECPFFALDLDAEGRLIGIEVLEASKYLPKELLEHALRIQKLKSEPRDFLSPGC
jgi:uncharacterized protein YuzE